MLVYPLETNYITNIPPNGKAEKIISKSTHTEREEIISNRPPGCQETLEEIGFWLADDC